VFGTLLNVLNALLIAGAGAIAIALWLKAQSRSAPSRWCCRDPQLTNMSRQIAVQITDLFEEIGIVRRA
jgi:hypothetical protein